MGRDPRGICVIINQEDFDEQLKLDSRRGTDSDADSLRRTFEVSVIELKIRTSMPTQTWKSRIENPYEFVQVRVPGRREPAGCGTRPTTE